MDSFFHRTMADMNNTSNKITSLLIVLTVVWFILLSLLISFWAYALPIFNIVTLVKKKQYAWSAAIYTLAIISIIVLVFLLAVLSYSFLESIASGKIKDEYLAQLPTMLDWVLIIVLLVFNIKLVKNSGIVRKERMLASGWQPGSQDNANRQKPAHVASIIIGIVAILSFFGFITMGIPSIVCGIIGMVIAEKAKSDYSTNAGSLLSTIGLIMGAFGLILSIETRFT